MYNTIIIGAGPAGITASIYLKRAGVDFLLIEKGEVGGLLLNANMVENYPGIPKSLSGPALVSRLKKQMQSLGIETTHDEVIRVKTEKGRFLVKTVKGSYTSKNLIVASGTRPKELKIPGDVKIHYEVYPLRSTKGKHIAIVGGGDAAFDYALNLARNNRVSIFYRKVKCLRLLYERAKASGSITLHPETEVLSAEGGTIDLILAAIGRVPADQFIENKNEKIYYAGDVMRGSNRQTIIAVSDGARAAMDIIRNENN